MYAQDICVNLSMQNTPLTARDTLLPYLRIEYSNNSDKSYYFPAVASYTNAVPFFYSSFNERHLGNISYDYCKTLLFEQSYFNGEHYLLPLDFITTQGQPMLELCVMSGDEFEGAVISFLLSYYQSFITTEEKTHNEFYSWYHLRCPLKLKNSPTLVFLKPGEKSIQNISLKQIEKTGIILTVFLSSNRISRKVKTGESYNCLHNLPEIVSGYHLYNGIIESNTITVDFSVSPSSIASYPGSCP